MVVSKDGEVVHCGSTGCCGTLRCQSEYHIQTAAPIQAGIHMTWRIGQEVGDHVSPDRVDRSIRLATLRNRRIVASVCTDHHKPATCFPVEIPESCPEASPNSWSNNLVYWWPVLPVSCGSLLARRDFSKFLLDHLSSLGRIFRYDHDIGTQ